MNITGIFSNQVLGISFLVVALVLMLLMFRAWAYPYDKSTGKSSAPRRLVWTHRLLGWVYVAIYVILMIQMVPRLWTYQVELPARTVAHLVLGLSIGGLLFTKLLIVRFFKHMEAKLVPLLGTLLFLCTLVMILMALPLTLRESFLQDSITAGSMLDDERIERLRTQLPAAGIDDPEQIEALITSKSLVAGRQVLTGKCTQCHDLRTVLVRPRTPDNWAQTVKRMANRSNVLQAISADEQLKVTTYLLAISPTLQNSLMQQRDQQSKDATTRENAASSMDASTQAPDSNFDVDAARMVFERTCSQCHAYQLVDARPPATREAVKVLMTRMTTNGLVSDAETLMTVANYLNHTYAKDDAPQAAVDQPDTPVAAQTPPAGNTTGDTTEPVGDMALAEQSGCTGCHNVDFKILGPAWKDVAQRYANETTAFNGLVSSVKDGSIGKWTEQTGGVPMPANHPRVSEQDIQRLVRFILNLNNQ